MNAKKDRCNIYFSFVRTTSGQGRDVGVEGEERKIWLYCWSESYIHGMSGGGGTSCRERSLHAHPGCPYPACVVKARKDAMDHNVLRRLFHQIHGSPNLFLSLRLLRLIDNCWLQFLIWFPTIQQTQTQKKKIQYQSISALLSYLWKRTIVRGCLILPNTN